jgi:RimJ/RimL family protein N-acetyltransferase
MNRTVRAVQRDDWAKVKEIRLVSLQDPVAHIAFLQTYEQAMAQSDDFWRDRAAGAAEGRSARQFVAEAADGSWLGTVSVLVERPGAQSVFGDFPEMAQTHIVGVYVRPVARGTGLAEELFQAALEWSWSLVEPRIERVRLFVHEDNTRAEAMYGKVGFKRTGVSAPVPDDATRCENELALLRS